MYPEYEIDYRELLIVVGQFALLIALPAAAAVVWSIRQRTSWRVSLLAAAAFAVIFAVSRTPLWEGSAEAIQALGTYLGRIGIVFSLEGFWLMDALRPGILYMGVFWLMFRYAATNIRSWRHAVMFALCFSAVEVVYRAAMLAYDRIEDYEPFDYSLQIALSVYLSNTSPLRWVEMAAFIWDWVLEVTALNVGTSLAIFFSVQRRNVWLLLVAILWYVASRTAAPIWNENFIDLTVGGVPPLVSRFLLSFLASTLATLIPFLLLLPLRRTKTPGESLHLSG